MYYKSLLNKPLSIVSRVCSLHGFLNEQGIFLVKESVFSTHGFTDYRHPLGWGLYWGNSFDSFDPCWVSAEEDLEEYRMFCVFSDGKIVYRRFSSLDIFECIKKELNNN